MVEQLAPDVAIVDIGMPVLNGLETTRKIVQTYPRTQVLILTMHQSDEVVREVLRAGARGYVLKSDADQHLIAAIENPVATQAVSDFRRDEYCVDEVSQWPRCSGC
jgi:DNA-binding NarL/FixJ family response regulator